MLMVARADWTPKIGVHEALETEELFWCLTVLVWRALRRLPDGGVLYLSVLKKHFLGEFRNNQHAQIMKSLSA